LICDIWFGVTAPLAAYTVARCVLTQSSGCSFFFGGVRVLE